MELTRRILAALFKLVFRVRVSGLEHYRAAGERVLIVANHTSFLDALLLAVFLPDRLSFAVNTHIARRWYFRPFLALVDIFTLDPTHPLSIKRLIRYLGEDRRVVIFPEGRITVTGALMKVYPGPGLVADRSAAMVLPVRIEGAQYTPFSRLRGRVRLRWFPRITLTIQPPRRIAPPPEVRGRARRKVAGQMLADLMTQMMYETSDYRRTLFRALLDARRIHGGRHRVVDDIDRRPLHYNQLIGRAFILGRALGRETRRGERVGLILPSAVNTVVSFLALQAWGRVPAMLNFTLGLDGMRSACRAAQLRTVYTSRRFARAARLEDTLASLGETVRVRYLEDMVAELGLFTRLSGWLAGQLPGLLTALAYRHAAGAVRPDDPAVVLFTSGSEGSPKGVVLSHANLLANREQLAARVDFGAQDVILNALPLFHSFGLTAGTLLPLTAGMRVFFYPSPLHYRIIPEMAYDINATILFGTNTFLNGYARFAHPYDFYSVRYAFAGAERLQEETRRLWAEKFGIRIFEGYGATETSPVLAATTPMDYQAGSVGRFLPGIVHRLVPVPGVEAGGRLEVRGPNVMLGYLLVERPGELVAPATEAGPGWYDTGDIVSVDEDGFVRVCGRAKRFAKIGGEMVSLAAVEALAEQAWPGCQHAALSVGDRSKGEQLLLVTEQPGAQRSQLLKLARAQGIGEIAVPRRIVSMRRLPLLGTGKIDYTAVTEILTSQEAAV